MKRQLLIIVMGLTSLVVSAQENEFSIDAQLRTRAEYNNGAITPRDEHELPATFLNNRSRLSLDWKRDNLELKASLQHVGVWGQDDIKDQNGRVAMNEAWGKFTYEINNHSHFIQIGRQQLVYDDERILGSLDWHVAGNWHDAIRYGWDSKYDAFNDQLHIVVAHNQNRDNVRGGIYNPAVMPYKNLYMARYHMDFSTTPLSLSIMSMSVDRESAIAGNSDTKSLHLFGTDINFKPSNLEIHGAFYYESGKNIADQSISAWMASAKVGYNINEDWKVQAGYDYLSGADDDDTSGKQKKFDTLFGSHHMFLGSMDYFAAIPNQGLSDIQAGISTKVLKPVSMQFNYHYFMLNNKKLNALGEKMNSGLGHELDFQISAKVQKDVTLVGGYSFMLGSETMDVVKGGNHKSWQDWAWIQLNINPRMFFTKW